MCLLAAFSIQARVAVQWQASNGVNDPASPGQGANLAAGARVQLFWSADDKIGGDTLLATRFTTHEGWFAFGPEIFGTGAEYEGGRLYIKVTAGPAPRPGIYRATSAFSDMSSPILPDYMTPVMLDMAGAQMAAMSNQCANPLATGGNMDMDGSGQAALVVYDPVSGRWYVVGLDSALLLFGRKWGAAGMIPVRGDYDGDGIGDLALYDPDFGYWYVMAMDGSIVVWNEQWGGSGYVPVAGDYDGDGISDLAVYFEAAGTWFIRTLNNEILAWDFSWGTPGLEPVSGDYDGDWISDLAFYHEESGTWYILALDNRLIAWAEW